MVNKICHVAPRTRFGMSSQQDCDVRPEIDLAFEHLSTWRIVLIEPRRDPGPQQDQEEK